MPAAQAQIIPGSAGAGGAALGNSLLAIEDHWATLGNQAQLANLEGFSAGIYGYRPYSIKQLNGGAIAAAYAIDDIGVIAASISHFGNGNNYGRQEYGLSYARKFGKARGGIKFGLVQTNLAEYGQKTKFLLRAGVAADLTHKITAGFHISNPTLTYNSKNTHERLPSTATLGLLYHYSNKVTTVAEVQQEIGKKLRLLGGLEYHPDERLTIRIGIASAPIGTTFGIGYKLRDINLNLGFALHSQLGLTPNLSLDYQTEEL